MAAILTYHKIGRQRELGITTVGRRRLASHLDYLLATGRRLVTASEVVSVAPDAGAAPADDPVAITFDDGYESVYTAAFPELAARGMAATIFPVVGAVGSTNTWDVRLSLRRERHLSWEQIKDLAARGFEFGSHSLSHRDLTALADAALREDLSASKRALEDRTGMAVRAIAYPFGKYDARVIGAAREAGYTCGFASSPAAAAAAAGAGPAAAGASAPFGPMAIGRMSVYCLDGRGSLARKLGGGAGHRLEAVKNRAIARLSRGTILVKRSGWRLP